MTHDDDAIARARARWKWNGTRRPPWADAPGPGQESVWDYPRPPRLAHDTRLVEVRAGELLVASTRAAVRVLETASPPTFYVPPDDVAAGMLESAEGESFCEWKGAARYFDVVAAGARVARAAWCYPEPRPGFEAIAGWLSFYPARLLCTVDGERVRPQPGGFYGGWVTSEIVGPYKGDGGTSGW